VIDLAYPFEGRWLTQNSPADRVPSHGTALFGASYAIDFVPVVALCHLQRASVQVWVGQRVRAGQTLARCGNSGNSTEPHLHVQAVDRPDVLHASGVPITFGGRLSRNGEIVDASQG
jgi:hypothetical protein